MNATLTLDDDVAVLLERATKERGESLEKLGNSLLRRTLRSERDRERELMGEIGFTLTAPRQPESDALRAVPPMGTLPLEEQIDRLYDEIRELVGRSAENPGLKTEIESKREQLQALQAEEASAWRQRADARRHLKPGEGYRLLERATSLLDS